MRKYQIVLGCLTIIALLGMTVLTGCPGRDEPDMIYDEADLSDVDPAMEGDPQTVADLMVHWPSSFVMDISFEDKETGETETATMTMMMGADGPAKIKMVVPGEAGAFILDQEEMMMYSWDESSGQGMMMSLEGAEEDAEMEGIANPYGEVDTDAQIVGSETIDGVDCWVVEFISSEDEEEARIYYAKENGLVQRVETDTMVANYSYSDIGTVSPEVFEVPEGIEMMDLSELGNLGDLDFE